MRLKSEGARGAAHHVAKSSKNVQNRLFWTQILGERSPKLLYSSLFTKSMVDNAIQRTQTASKQTNYTQKYLEAIVFRSLQSLTVCVLGYLYSFYSLCDKICIVYNKFIKLFSIQHAG